MEYLYIYYYEGNVHYKLLSGVNEEAAHIFTNNPTGINLTTYAI